MGKIRVLPDEVASQVAAGEVVERPASLVKELVENSLDAGARRITVDFVGGGVRFVAVRDDGCGMDRQDALLCLERHGTSKIRLGSDLAGVRTMGFRGEALPSMASVSRFRLITRESLSESGTEVLVNGGRVETVRETGAPPGTQVEVRDLFFNLPARRKFLRGEETEAAHIAQTLHAIALAHPGVAMEWRRDGRTLGSVPAGTLAERIRDIFGAEHLARMEPLAEWNGEGIRLGGYLARPGEGRRDRLRQFVILNGRPIVCTDVQQPLREAYAGALASGLHPTAVLVLEMNPELFDCNVHPAKREVRLRRPEILRQLVFDAAREVVGRSKKTIAGSPVGYVTRLPSFSPEPLPDLIPDVRRVQPSESDCARPEADPAPNYRALGVIGDGYALFDGPEGLVLMDCRAAAERIQFENLLRHMEAGDAPSQQLLIPVICELPPREFAAAAEWIGELQTAGFSIEPFGAGSMKIDAVPALARNDAANFLHETLAAIRALGSLPRGRGMREALARTVSRLSSGNAPRDPGLAASLLHELLACDLPYAAPDGRPSLIQFSFAELDRKFGRTK